jgi:hypothetical protein
VVGNISVISLGVQVRGARRPAYVRAASPLRRQADRSLSFSGLQSRTRTRVSVTVTAAAVVPGNGKHDEQEGWRLRLVGECGQERSGHGAEEISGIAPMSRRSAGAVPLTGPVPPALAVCAVTRAKQ